MGKRTHSRICPNCGVWFKTFYSINSIYCSKKCFQEYKKKVRWEKNSRPCIVCGKLFIPKHNKSKGVYCSYKCSGKARRKDRIFRGGYWYIHFPQHQHCTKQGYVMEHRVVMEQHLKRFLKPNEVVHHINHDSSDNRINNLVLYDSPGKHSANEHIHREKTGKFVKSNSERSMYA